MTTLVVLLAAGSWNHVTKLIEGENWTKVIVVANQENKDKFVCNKSHEFIVLKEEWTANEMIAAIKKGLEKEYGEIGLNFVLGTGKEHMAVVAAVMQAGLSFRLIAVTKEGIKEL